MWWNPEITPSVSEDLPSVPSVMAGRPVRGDSRFADLIRCLAEGKEPPAAVQRRFLEALKGALIAAMRRRSLWASSPRVLGYSAASWIEGDALDDLLAELLVFVLRRLERLCQRQGHEVAKLVFINVKHFLTEEQKRHDPIGYSVYRDLREALRRLIEERRVRVVEGSKRIENDTVLTLVEGGAGRTTDEEGFVAWAQREADRLMPGLLVAQGRAREKVRDLIVEAVARLPGEGVVTFRFRDPVAALKRVARARYRALCEIERGPIIVEEMAHGSRQALKIDSKRSERSEVLERRDFGRWVQCISDGVEALDLDPRSRAHVASLWKFYWIGVASAIGGADSAGDVDTVTAAVVADLEGYDGSKPLADRRLGKRLGIPRERLPRLRRELQKLWRACRVRLEGLAGAHPTV